MMWSNILLISRLARRNIFRNSRRTLLTICLISFSLAALIFTDAFVRGSLESLVKISTETFFGDGQIHRQGFREANDIDLYLTDPATVFAQLDSLKEVAHYAPRVITGGMVSSSENVASAMVYAIESEQEALLSKLKQAMYTGDYLAGNSGEILLGEDLASLLEVGLGDRIVVTVSQAHGGELSQELFRLSGIFRFNDRQMDGGMAFINLSQGQSLLNIQGVHEVALRLHDQKLADDKTRKLWQQLNNDQLETLTWRELIPQLSSMLEMSRFTTLIASAVMFSLVVLGLVNTMFMSIYERHNEFGILLAIGTRPRQLFWQIIAEGFGIGLISVVAGVLMGWAVAFWVSIYGIDYSDMEMSGITLNEPIYTIIEPLAFVQLSLALLVITSLACLYPAIHAAKLEPSFAMRKTL